MKDEFEEEGKDLLAEFISVYTKDGDIKNIISLVNLQPFKLLNLNWSNYTSKLEKAIDDSIKLIDETKASKKV